MKVLRVNYHDPATIPPSADVLDEVHDIQFLGHGVKVTVTERPDGISVHVDPSLEPYKHALAYDEVAASGGQIRVSGVRGTVRL